MKSSLHFDHSSILIEDFAVMTLCMMNQEKQTFVVLMCQDC